jgi:hypothetical protein
LIRDLEKREKCFNKQTKDVEENVDVEESEDVEESNSCDDE